MQIRITIETADAKYSNKLDSETSLELIQEYIEGTLHRINHPAPTERSLTLLEITPGYVDAELSRPEFELLVGYRNAVAAVPSFDPDLYSASIALIPKPATPAASAFIDPSQGEDD